MKRRTVLRSLLTVPAAAALPEAVAQEKTTLPVNRDTPSTPVITADATTDAIVKTFNHAQFAALRKLGEILVPAAPDTPGAVECGSAEFLDFLIGVSPAERVTLYRGGLDRLNSESQRLHKKPFAEITASEAEPILAPLRAPWSYRGPADHFAKFLVEAKGDLLTATANSREYITVVSQRRRSAGGSGQYWYPIE